MAITSNNTTSLLFRQNQMILSSRECRSGDWFELSETDAIFVLAESDGRESYGCLWLCPSCSAGDVWPSSFGEIKLTRSAHLSIVAP